MKRSGIVIITFLAALAVASTASADEYTPSEDANRRGIMIGIGLNGGHMQYEFPDGNDGGSLNNSFGAELHIAYMVSKKLALSADAWAMRHNYTTILNTDGSLTNVLATFGPQYWVLPRLWLRAGFGYARVTRTEEIPILGTLESESENVPGLAVGVGLEVIAGPRFAVDVQMRAATGFYEDLNLSNVGLGVGFTWF